MAMSGTAVPAGKRYAVSANYGTYRGANAFAGGVALRLTNYAEISGSLGIGVDHGDAGGRVGATIAW
jgi:trimeric autotransporter adhesin